MNFELDYLDDEQFYTKVPLLRDLKDLTNADNFRNVPRDWYVAMTDVVGSTEAVKQGKYRDVNTVSAASITPFLNNPRKVDVPFAFGGDGATILIPPTLYDYAVNALLASRQIAAEAFDLEMRVGIIHVNEVMLSGYAVRVGRLFVSENFQQAVFSGGGISYAESLLKRSGDEYQLVPQSGTQYTANFDGFECRWQKVRSAHDETLSLLVSVVGPDPRRREVLFHEIVDRIDQIYGDPATRHPIRVENMHLSQNPLKFRSEAIIRFANDSMGTLLRMARNTFLVRIFMAFNIGNWRQYKDLFVAATDHEKFDDVLRMTISGNADQRQKLRDYLQRLHDEGQVAFGMHVSQYTLVTCIVFDYFGRQVHFVDGDAGGYAMAALELKSQLGRL